MGSVESNIKARGGKPKKVKPKGTTLTARGTGGFKEKLEEPMRKNVEGIYEREKNIEFLENNNVKMQGISSKPVGFNKKDKEGDHMKSTISMN